MKVLLSLLLALSAITASAQANPDTEQLGRALEYFTSAKYHEALIILERLDKQYRLNDRFRAYIGLCYYYEWDYKHAVSYFDQVADKLSALSPHEQSVYFYAAGESYFQLEKYDNALTYYNFDLPLCYDNERGEVLYRIGFCHMMLKHWGEAIVAYQKADKWLALRKPDDVVARRAQIANMIKGCQAEAQREYYQIIQKGFFENGAPLYKESIRRILSHTK